LEAAGVSLPQFGQVTGGHAGLLTFGLLMSVIRCKAHTLRVRAGDSPNLARPRVLMHVARTNVTYGNATDEA
jgi:hypothetical protein